MCPEDEHGDDAPARLVRDLQALYTSGRVPAGVDQAVLARSRRSLAARRRKRFLVLRALPAAAAAGLVIWLALERRTHVGTAVAAADVDGSGRVDIVDAYVLALRIEERPVDPSERARWDLNEDGALDRLDVDAVASAAVKVGS
jgi:hypothetical protein